LIEDMVVIVDGLTFYVYLVLEYTKSLCKYFTVSMCICQIPLK
jgi:hypothetical protein